MDDPPGAFLALGAPPEPSAAAPAPPPTRDERTVYVGNVSPSASHAVLRELFAHAGPIARLVILAKSPQRRYAFCEYESAASVPYAVYALQGVTVCGQALAVRRTTGGRGQRCPACCVVAADCPPRWSPADVAAALAAACGPVAECAAAAPGVAVVEFATPAVAAAAVAARVVAVDAGACVVVHAFDDDALAALSAEATARQQLEEQQRLEAQRQRQQREQQELLRQQEELVRQQQQQQQLLLLTQQQPTPLQLELLAQQQQQLLVMQQQQIVAQHQLWQQQQQQQQYACQAQLAACGGSPWALQLQSPAQTTAAAAW
eukprot:m51a1_g13178 hypothetical protein (318) ;mRNA; r:99960-101099